MPVQEYSCTPDGRLSVDVNMKMIDRFYSEPLSGETNPDMLQSKRRPRKIYEGDLGVPSIPPKLYIY